MLEKNLKKSEWCSSRSKELEIRQKISILEEKINHL